MVIRLIRPDEAQVLRDIRLRALEDSPEAFGASLADEAAFDSDVWTSRADTSARGVDDATFVSEVDGGLDGMVTAHRDADAPERIGLYGLWVSPAARGIGVGRALTEAALDWALSRGAQIVHLWVLAGNDVAEAFYLRVGFIETGRTSPSWRDPSILALEMELSLD
jgi:GNAT superfamily N-acetyltransferase